MMRRRAGFQPDEARRNRRKESQDLAASQPLAHYYAACLIDQLASEANDLTDEAWLEFPFRLEPSVFTVST